jgi:hypothetical protein
MIIDGDADDLVVRRRYQHACFVAEDESGGRRDPNWATVVATIQRRREAVA